jgi:hypothetical protein
LAKREYEAWFITARESLRAYRDLNLTATIVRDPEEILGAKEWLSRQMHRGKAYVEIRHQPAFTQLMDLELAKKARSFRKFVREIELLLAGSVQAPQGL